MYESDLCARLFRGVILREPEAVDGEQALDGFRVAHRELTARKSRSVFMRTILIS